VRATGWQVPSQWPLLRVRSGPRAEGRCHLMKKQIKVRRSGAIKLTASSNFYCLCIC